MQTIASPAGPIMVSDDVARDAEQPELEVGSVFDAGPCAESGTEHIRGCILGEGRVSELGEAEAVHSSCVGTVDRLEVQVADRGEDKDRSCHL